MTTPRFTPYDGSSEPFTIGLKQIDPDIWIETDSDLEIYLDEKERLLGDHRPDIFVEMEGSLAAQRESLALITAHLTNDHAETYSLREDQMEFGPRRVSLNDETSPLMTAGSLIADDLVILENRDGGWRITAGYVAFPSSWSLKEKAGLTISEVHAPVPAFGDGSRNDTMVRRIFDNLQPGRIIERFNWSLYPDGRLYCPIGKSTSVSPAFDPADSFIRVERQTLRKLPETGALLFTIRIYRNPIAAVTARPELAEQLAGQFAALTPEQLAYKGMTANGDAVVAFLSRA